MLMAPAAAVAARSWRRVDDSDVADMIVIPNRNKGLDGLSGRSCETQKLTSSNKEAVAVRFAGFQA
jgi:hypothetical protein